MHYKLMFPSKYMGAHDLDGKDVTATIEKIQLEDLTMVGGIKSRKPVITFKGAKKQWIMNVTNGAIIAKIYGPFTKDWIGKKITLYPTTCKLKGDRVECVRVREKAG